MPACARSRFFLRCGAGGLRRRALRGALVVTLLGGAALALASGFKVSSVEARAIGETLHLGGNLELALTPKVEEAVGKGIPIELAIDVRLLRQRQLLWDKRLASWTVRRELRYHALSGQYLISGAGTSPLDRESVNSLGEALLEIGALDDVTLPLRTSLDPGAEYRVDVRVALDIEALPSLLRPVAYTSRAWDLNSGWTTWKVQR